MKQNRRGREPNNETIVDQIKSQQLTEGVTVSHVPTV